MLLPTSTNESYKIVLKKTSQFDVTKEEWSQPILGKITLNLSAWRSSWHPLIVTWLLFDLKKLFSKGRVQNKSGKFYFCVWTAPSTCNLNFEILFGSFCSVSLGIPSRVVIKYMISKLLTYAIRKQIDLIF